MARGFSELKKTARRVAQARAGRQVAPCLASARNVHVEPRNGAQPPQRPERTALGDALPLRTINALSGRFQDERAQNVVTGLFAHISKEHAGLVLQEMIGARESDR